jgi:hypothetical protein
MYLSVILLLLLLAFLALCFIGLLSLIKQAIADPPFAAPRAFFFEDPSHEKAASEDPEGRACGEGCA